ncbi:hypothetical protein HMI51_40220 [Corallococcus coralloides]|nr:hypothetical protein [Corallococcus coralloides]NOJ99123.1 hypothetical protein [Corallococcus coralloides]NOJ99124.1 hypothetical protein [Corallococcus coralloides]
MTITAAANNSLNSALSTSGGLSALEQQSLSGLDKGSPEYKRAEAQLLLQKLQETVSFISNMLKKKNEIAMATIGNLR